MQWVWITGKRHLVMMQIRWVYASDDDDRIEAVGNYRIDGCMSESFNKLDYIRRTERIASASEGTRSTEERCEQFMNMSDP